MAVLRRDLSRDYYLTSDVLQAARGRVEAIPTARAFYTGRVELHCTFDDFSVDTPLNRVIRAAAREVSRSTLLTAEVRKDASRILARLEDVGELRVTDVSAAVERRTWYYRDSIALAKHILRCVGRTFASGAETAWSFLIRTPELVEAGVRQTLADRFADLQVRKVSAAIRGSTWGVHPDIVFGSGWGIADVKYKVTDGSWNRPDLYEVVAFAAAFKAVEAALICFAKGPVTSNDLGLGHTNVAQFIWNCSVEPVAASADLCNSIKTWAEHARTRTTSVN